MEKRLKIRTKLGLVVSIAALATLAGSLSPTSAFADSDHQEFMFSETHPCTHEQVVGDTRVDFDSTTQDNGDGTTTVTMTQRTHGNQLVGVLSDDTYVINEHTETTETFIISTSLGGSVSTKSVFIHNGENQANTEIQGLDDLHQRLTWVFAPGGPPMMVEGTSLCK
jgi:hypothetical protein